MEIKKYVVIEQAEGYDYLYSLTYFNNLEDAKNHFIEAVDMFQLNSKIAEIKILKEWNKV